MDDEDLQRQIIKGAQLRKDGGKELDQAQDGAQNQYTDAIILLSGILILCLLILLLGISIHWIRKLYLNAKKNEFFGRDRSSSCSCSSMDLSEIERNRCDSITSSEGCDCEQCCGQGSQYI